MCFVLLFYFILCSYRQSSIETKYVYYSPCDHLPNMENEEVVPKVTVVGGPNEYSELTGNTVMNDEYAGWSHTTPVYSEVTYTQATDPCTPIQSYSVVVSTNDAEEIQSPTSTCMPGNVYSTQGKEKYATVDKSKKQEFAPVESATQSDNGTVNLNAQMDQEPQEQSPSEEDMPIYAKPDLSKKKKLQFPLLNTNESSNDFPPPNSEHAGKSHTTPVYSEVTYTQATDPSTPILSEYSVAVNADDTEEVQSPTSTCMSGSVNSTQEEDESAVVNKSTEQQPSPKEEDSPTQSDSKTENVNAAEVQEPQKLSPSEEDMPVYAQPDLSKKKKPQLPRLNMNNSTKNDSTPPNSEYAGWSHTTPVYTEATYTQATDPCTPIQSEYSVAVSTDDTKEIQPPTSTCMSGSVNSTQEEDESAVVNKSTEQQLSPKEEESSAQSDNETENSNATLNQEPQKLSLSEEDMPVYAQPDLSKKRKPQVPCLNMNESSKDSPPPIPPQADVL